MLIRRKLLSAVRCFAAGIDVGPREARLVIVSRKRRANRPVRIEWAGAAPVAAGAMSGAHIVDRAAVTAALSSLCARWPRRCVMRGVVCSMAIPGGGAVVSSSVTAAVAPLDEQSAAASCIDERWHAFEEAGRASAPEHGARMPPASHAHWAARVEAAAAAGIALAGMEEEPRAALRALAYFAEHVHRADERCVAIWVGYGGVHAWRVADGAVEAAIRFPGGEHPDLESALRLVAGAHGLDRALVAGDVGLLEHIGLSLADIGERLGCHAVEFDCAPFCCRRAVLAEFTGGRHAAAYAVAFGLALRGVAE